MITHEFYFTEPSVLNKENLGKSYFMRAHLQHRESELAKTLIEKISVNKLSRK